MVDSKQARDCYAPVVPEHLLNFAAAEVIPASPGLQNRMALDPDECKETVYRLERQEHLLAVGYKQCIAPRKLAGRIAGIAVFSTISI